MESYYINNTPDDKGNHEIHVADCVWLNKAFSKTYLGEFASCHEALIKAKQLYSRVDGCYYCCRPCHHG